MNKKIIGAVVALIIVGGGAFYGGMVYAKGSTPARGAFGAGFTGATGTAGRTGTRAGGGFTAGTVVSSANGSVTIQEAQGGSTEIVLVSGSTQILKSVAGSLTDLAPGTTVTVTGTSNSDGSLTASSIQIRPAGSNAPMIPAGGAPAAAQQ